MATEKLTDRVIRAAKPGSSLTDGRGLTLRVTEQGSKRWELAVTIKANQGRGRRRYMGLGSYPDVSLADAREIASQYRLQARSGVDPIQARDAEHLQTPTFTRVAAMYIRAHRHAWKNPKHARQWVRTLKTYARPVIGQLPVTDITTEHVLKILQPIWKSKTETAKRLQGRIENVLDYSRARKFMFTDNPARWRGHLEALLPKPGDLKSEKHHPAMPHAHVGEFMEELGQSDAISAYALRLLILTATRTSEVLKAQWSEFDLDAATWTIPASRMKARKLHRIPLSTEALAVLNELPKRDQFVFANPNSKKPLSGMSLLTLMRRRGYGPYGDRGECVPHGFRSSFRDWASECTPYSHECIERSLAHVIANKAEAAYARSDLLEQRRPLMQAWSDYLIRSNSGDVLTLNFGARGG